MEGVQIRPAIPSDIGQLAPMLEALWPKSSVAEHAEELRAYSLVLTMPLAIFVAETSAGELVGFVEAEDLRSHADGYDPSNPAGFVEGWYVAEDKRHRGVGKKLLENAEDWSRSHGCTEIGSDALIDNRLSQQAHEALGYQVVDRCVHYRKTL